MVGILLQGLSGVIIGLGLFYLLGSMLLKQWIRLDAYQLTLSMGVTFLVAIVCEISIDRLYFSIMDKPLWLYHVWPIHQGYTSGLNFIVWPAYGFYLYLVHKVLVSKRVLLRPRWLHGLLSGIDGPLLEILANGFFLLFYGTFYFYYLPDDMGHYSSIQVIPIYMLVGVVLSLILDHLRRYPRNWLYPSVSYVMAVGVMFV
ncbi:MAG: hypothetical protein HWE24_06460 [Oceanospirillaceae bacterium]|nr:hypothetical protein [Oceanospirillaceae bacterium]